MITNSLLNLVMGKKGLFITGTDTDAGKTYISSLIIRALRAEDMDTIGYKPICCGDRNDAVEFADASGLSMDDEAALNRINPVWMKTPAAPHVAAMFENLPIEKQRLLDGYQTLIETHDCVITEGVGGWLVPIQGMEFSVAELAIAIGDPVLLIVGNKLGALNHTLLTVEAMRSRGVEPAGLIFNNLMDELDTATITNKGIVEDMCGVEVITDVIRGQESIESWPFMELLGL